ncbi:hypothetical protein ACIOD0_30180 [Kitasatospora albolonga]
MGHFGLFMLAAGTVGLIVSTKGERGWYNWSREQKIGASASSGIMLAGLILMDMYK